MADSTNNIDKNGVEKIEVPPEIMSKNSQSIDETIDAVESTQMKLDSSFLKVQAPQPSDNNQKFMNLKK